MLKKLIIIIMLLDIGIVFSQDLKPIIKYNTIPLQQKARKRISKDYTSTISKISKMDRNQKVLVSYDFCVNWVEEQNNNGILIYPNPTLNGEITVKLSNTNSSFTNIKLFDKEGNLINFTKEFKLLNSFKITGLNKGVYYLNFNGEISPFIVE
ncbi:MAG: T9SS type A sorting domain-containing protein [Candidatus Kapaibacteriota bacterium]